MAAFPSMKYAKDCPTPHRHGSRTKLRLFPSRLVWFWARVSLIDIGQFNDAFVSGLLNGSGEASDLGAIIPVGWRDMQGQQVAQRIHSHMQLRAPFAFGPVVTGARPALGCRT